MLTETKQTRSYLQTDEGYRLLTERKQTRLYLLTDEVYILLTQTKQTRSVYKPTDKNERDSVISSDMKIIDCKQKQNEL